MNGEIKDVFVVNDNKYICVTKDKIIEHNCEYTFGLCECTELKSFDNVICYSIYNPPITWTFDMHKYMDNNNFKNNVYQLILCIKANKLPICKNVLWLIVCDIYRYYSVIIN
jgi:hypothetical protein